MATFYERFVELCHEKGILQVKALQSVGRKCGSLDSYKKGNTPKRNALEGLAKLLNVSAEYLAGESDIKNKAYDPEITELLRIYENADDECKRKILENARAIVSEQKK